MAFRRKKKVRPLVARLLVICSFLSGGIALAGDGTTAGAQAPVQSSLTVPVPAPADPCSPSVQVIDASTGNQGVLSDDISASHLEIIFDSSGSMNERLGGRTRMAIARQVLEETVQSLEAKNVLVAFRAFGFDDTVEKVKETSCENTELLIDFGKKNAGAIGARSKELRAFGYTPIAKSLRLAGIDLEPYKDSHPTILLISDNQETCGGNPVAEAQRLRTSGINVYVLGLDLDDISRKQLKAVAQAGHGIYYDVENKRTGECKAKKGSKADGAKALKLIQSSPVTLSFAVPKLSLGQLSPSNAYRLEFSDQRPVPGNGRDDNREQAWQQAFTELVNDLAQEAFLQGAKMANRTLPTPLPRRELEAFISQLDYGNYVEVGKINRQQIERKYRDGRVEETLHLQITFLVARQQLLNELAPPPTPTNFAGPKINPADFPSETTHVVKFEDEAFPVTADVVDRAANRQAAFAKAIDALSRAAFKNAALQIHKTQRNQQTREKLEEFIHDHLAQQNFQRYTDNYQIRRQEIARLGSRETLQLSVYFYFDRQQLGDALRPPLKIIPLDRNQYADTAAQRVPLSSAVTLEVPFELQERSIAQAVEDREMARRQAYTGVIEELAQQALQEALARVNADLDKPKPSQALATLLSKIGSDYRNYTRNREITHQAIKRRGSATTAAETLQLTMYFYFDRRQIKDLLQPAERSTSVTLNTQELLRMDVPASDDATYVAVFRDQEVPVPSDVQDKDLARKRAARNAIEVLKREAFKQAAEDINHQLAQPMDEQEFERAIAKTSANFQHYVLDFKWIDEPQVITHGDYSTAAESLRLNLYFQVDRKALRRALVNERAITLVGRYRTYVELYWNVPDKFENYPPEMIKEIVSTVLENVEDYFSAKDYEIVEFESIRGELIALMQEMETGGISEDDLYSQDEYQRLQSNLALRSISNWSSAGVSWQAQQGSQSQFEFGKRILADYADLLLGVTINTIEPSQDGHLVTIRLTINATLFERGEWVKLASSDAARSLPFEPGGINLIIEGGKVLSRQLAAELEPKIKHKLARRKAAEEVLTETEQVFIVVFKGASKQQFAQIKRRLSDSGRWEYKSTDVRKRTARIAFEGTIDNFADRLEMFLSGAGLEVGLPEYVSSQRRIVFNLGQ